MSELLVPQFYKISFNNIVHNNLMIIKTDKYTHIYTVQ